MSWWGGGTVVGRESGEEVGKLSWSGNRVAGGDEGRRLQGEGFGCRPSLVDVRSVGNLWRLGVAV